MACHTAQKKEVSQIPADSVTFTEVILNGKLHFLCSVKSPNFALDILRKNHFATLLKTVWIIPLSTNFKIVNLKKSWL